MQDRDTNTGIQEEDDTQKLMSLFSHDGEQLADTLSGKTEIVDIRKTQEEQAQIDKLLREKLHANEDAWAKISATLQYVDEPHLGDLTDEHMDAILIHCAKMGASDINFKTDMPVVLERHGMNFQITERSLTNKEIGLLISKLYGSHGESQLKKGQDLDGAYDYQVSDRERYRFRFCVTGCIVRGSFAIHIVLRTIVATPMKLSAMDVEEGITNNFKHDNGMIVICGPTGSGKSSLLAGMIVDYLEDPFAHRKILTFESPIEYVYDNIVSRHSFVVQTSIPEQLPTFEAGIRNSLRRSPKIILLGEARDRETIEATLEAAETGHTVYTTVHANNTVSEVFYRLLNKFPMEERDSKMYEILDAMRMVVIQRLERTVADGRTALREFLVLTPAIREQLRECSTLKELADRLQYMVLTSEGYAQSMAACAHRKFTQGIISKDTWDKYALRYKQEQELIAKM